MGDGQYLYWNGYLKMVGNQREDKQIDGTGLLFKTAPGGRTILKFILHNDLKRAHRQTIKLL